MAKFSLKDIKEKFSVGGGRDKLKSLLTPHRDWSIIVVVFILLFIALGVLSAYFFIQVKEEKIFSETKENTDEDFEVLDVEGLKEMVRFFENKENRFESLSEEKPSAVDPSL